MREELLLFFEDAVQQSASYKTYLLTGQLQPNIGRLLQHRGLVEKLEKANYSCRLHALKGLLPKN